MKLTEIYPRIPVGWYVVRTGAVRKDDQLWNVNVNDWVTTLHCGDEGEPVYKKYCVIRKKEDTVSSRLIEYDKALLAIKTNMEVVKSGAAGLDCMVWNVRNQCFLPVTKRMSASKCARAVCVIRKAAAVEPTTKEQSAAVLEPTITSPIPET